MIELFEIDINICIGISLADVEGLPLVFGGSGIVRRSTIMESSFEVSYIVVFSLPVFLEIIVTLEMR